MEDRKEGRDRSDFGNQLLNLEREYEYEGHGYRMFVNRDYSNP